MSTWLNSVHREDPSKKGAFSNRMVFSLINPYSTDKSRKVYIDSGQIHCVIWTNMFIHSSIRLKRRSRRILEAAVIWSLFEPDFDFHTRTGRKLFTEIKKSIVGHQNTNTNSNTNTNMNMNMNTKYKCNFPLEDANSLFIHLVNNIPNPYSALSVSYTHLTLPTKRIV